MSRNTTTIVITLITVIAYSGFAQGPPVEWYKGHGTQFEEHIHEGVQTSDGGYIGIGHAYEAQFEYTDMFVVKTKANGTLDWQRAIGTSDQFDVGICIAEVIDGYIAGGGLYSGTQQRGLVKLDFDGNIVWQKTYATTQHGAIRGIEIADDGGIVATGYTNNRQAGFIFIADESDGFIMKTDTDGNLLWDKGISATQGTKVRRDADSDGYAVASTVWVFDGLDHQDVRLIKTDSEGNEIWSNEYGGDDNDQCFDFSATSDGGYIFTGHTLSYGVVNWDYYLLKVDSNGNEEWHKTFGQPRGYDAAFIHDESYGVRQTPDGGFIVAGGSGDEYPYSESGHPSGPSDEWKVYLVKTDAQGNLEWEGIYGKPNEGNNAAEYIDLTSDGGYILFTDTDSETPPSPNNFGFMKIDQTMVCSVDLQSTSGPGSFHYRTSFTNYIPGGAPIDIWAEIYGPDDYYELLFVRTKLLPLAVEIQKASSYSISSTELGDYDLILNAGTFPGQIECSDIATYQKTAVARWPSTNNVQNILEETALLPNYPNPFNPSTTIRFALDREAGVVLKVYDTLGEEVATLMESYLGSGYHSVVWDAKNSQGQRVPSGIYFYQLRAGAFNQSKKMLLIR